MSCVRLGPLPMVAICMLLASSVVAQRTTGDFEVRVVDTSGRPLQGIQVSVSGAELAHTATALSDADGYARIRFLPVGSYSVRISSSSYATVTHEDVKVQLGRLTSLGEVRLNEADMEEVIVTARVLYLDPASTELSSNFTGQTIGMLPMARDYRSIIAYLPQTNVSFLGDPINIGGATGLENAYYIDGVNVTEGYTAGSSTRLPQNFIKAVELKVGGYQAEFGRATGGIVNVITLSGTNQFRADAYGYFTNNNLAVSTRRGALEPNSSDFSRYDVGLNISGPMVRDKLWFFLAYDPSVEREDLEIPGFGFHRDERISHQLAGKLNWGVSERTKFEVIVLGDPTTHDRVGSNWFDWTPSSLANVDPFLGDWEEGGYTVAINGHHNLGMNLIFDGSLSRVDSRQKAQGQTEIGKTEATFFDNRTGEWSGGYGNVFDHHNIRTAARASATLFHRGHELKAGLEFENNTLDDLWQWATPEDGPGFVSQDADSAFTAILLIRSGEFKTRIPSAYMQDSWTVSNRFRLNLGVRWDGLYVEDVNGDPNQQITDQVQPRVGFTYQIGRIGSQKIFGSAGRFYEQIPNLPLAFMAGGGKQWLYFSSEDPRNSSAARDTVVDSTGEPYSYDLRGQHFDEFTFGYERVAENGQWKFKARGIWRELRDVIEHYIANTQPFEWRFGNPGRGEDDFPRADLLDLFPEPLRRYTALELTAEKRFASGSFVAGSYVLSRLYGNYPGLFDHDTGVENPNSGTAFNELASYVDAEGRLPNDRPHVFKLYGAHRFPFGLGTGGLFAIQSGTPLSELGVAPLLPSGDRVFLSPRGTYGRTPWIWDLNLRFAYDVSRVYRAYGRLNPRLVLDVFHVFSQREPVRFDQLRFRGVDADGNQINENPNFMQPLAFQPPMTMRMGMEVSF